MSKWWFKDRKVTDAEEKILKNIPGARKMAYRFWRIPTEVEKLLTQAQEKSDDE